MDNYSRAIIPLHLYLPVFLVDDQSKSGNTTDTEVKHGGQAVIGNIECTGNENDITECYYDVMSGQESVSVFCKEGR